MDDINKEKQGKSDFMESLIREAKEERLKSKAKENEEIFPNENSNDRDDNKHKEEDKFDYYYSAEEEGGSNKRILIGIFGIGAIALMGYFGFNHFQDDKSSTQNSAIVATDKTKEIDSTASKEQKKEEVAIAPVQNATPKSTKEELKTEEKQSVASIETSNTETTDREKMMVATIIQSINQKKESSDKDIKVETPEKTAKKEIIVEKEIIVKKEKPKKVEKEIVKKRVVTEKKKPKKIVTKKVSIKKKPKKVQQRIVIIKKGDTLASISERFYGNPMEFKRIVRANRNIRSASSSLHLGQKIIVPRIEKEKKRRIITVKKGDTLAIIAKRFYGDSRKFQKIVDANYKIKSASSRLSIGQKIYVPR